MGKSKEKPLKFKRYPEYKDSGVEWLGEIPAHWDAKRIKWESPVLRGASPRPIDDPVYFDNEGDYAWVRIADVTAAGMYLKETTQRLSEFGSSLSVKLHPGELFLSIAGSVGKPCITNIKCCIHDGFVYFPKLSCNRKFLYYIFESGEPYKGLGKLGTQLNLNTDTVGSMHISFPSEDEQNAIAIFLDRETAKIDALIAKKERLIALLQEKRTALITHAITKGLDPDVPMKDSGVEWLGEIPEHWEVKRIKYIFRLSRGFDLPSEKFSPGSYPVYGSNGIIGYHDKYTTEGPCVTVGRSGSVGEVNFVEKPFWAHNTALYVVESYSNNIDFIYFLLLSIDLKSLSAGSAVGTLNRNYIHNEYMSCPPIKEQIQIVEYVKNHNEKFGRIISRIKNVINYLQEYRTALISAAVTGKIDVREEAA